jgi:uncharacterized protein
MAFIDLNTVAKPAAEGIAFLDAATLFDLGLQLAAGLDGAADLVAAHMYFNLAARAGDERAAAHRQELAEQMTKAEVARALRAARSVAARQAAVTFH